MPIDYDPYQVSHLITGAILLAISHSREMFNSLCVHWWGELLYAGQPE